MQTRTAIHPPKPDERTAGAPPPPAPVRVSVVIPTYRRPALLARCRVALAAQGLPPSDYEILVADDAGSPETRAQVEAFAAQTAAAVRYVPVTGPHGPAAARNAGIEQARGHYLAAIDADDLWHPARIAKQLPLLEANRRTLLVYSPSALIDGNGRVVGRTSTWLATVVTVRG